MFSREILDLATQVIDQARSNSVMVATAESCTGGLVAAALTAVAGSSAVVDRGFVTYSNEAKAQMLGVSEGDLQTYGAVSEPVALAMAVGAVKHSGAEISVSITGIAGPGGGSDQKPVGLVHFAAMGTGGQRVQRQCLFGEIGRDAVREKSVIQALELLLEVLQS